MKKQVFLFAIFFVLIAISLSSSSAGNETQGYSCLEDILDNGCANLSLGEQIFSLMSVKECRSEVLDASNNEECWPNGDCSIKTTSQATLALDVSGRNVDDSYDWLVSKNMTSRDIEWFLQIDPVSASSCEIEFDSDVSNAGVSIDNDKKITEEDSSCFTISQNDYWLKISPSCLDKEMIITCDQSFLTSLIFKKKDSNVFYVSSTASSADADGITKEVIESVCFGEGSECDYEGSLWTTYVLSIVDKDFEIEPYLPYLITFADEEENEKFLPESFLYSLTLYNDYLVKIQETQKSAGTNMGYWQENRNNNKFYDTSVAMLALHEETIEERINAKNYLLDIQEDSGCWNSDNIRDTAFILYSVWPELAPSLGGGSGDADCEASGYYCRTSSFSCTNDGGEVLDDFSCYGSSVCCDVDKAIQTCDEQGGIICSSDEYCSGYERGASDVTSSEVCCISGECDEATDTIYSCEDNGGACRNGCFDSEISDSFYTCTDPLDACCFESSEPSESKNYIWLWILLILITLVVIGYFFKDKLRMILLRFKSGSSGRPSGRPSGPRFPPSTPPHFPPRRRPPRRIIPPQPRPAPKKTAPKKDNDLDDVLKKLKEIGQ